MLKLNKRQWMQRFGTWIQSLRRRKGLSQDQLTDVAGLARGTVSKIETGLVDPKITTLVRIAQALKISLRRFFDFAPKV
jgi:transcriptional regulator with XRE-family HTH domain